MKKLKNYAFIHKKNDEIKTVYAVGFDKDNATENALLKLNKVREEGYRWLGTEEIPDCISEYSLGENTIPAEQLTERKYFIEGDVIVSEQLPGRVFVYMQSIGFAKIEVQEIDPETFKPIGDHFIINKMSAENPTVFNFHPIFNPGSVHCMYI